MTIKDLKPTELWSYFYDITQIPRAPKKEEKILAYLLDFAKTPTLKKGESYTVQFEFTPYEMASYDCYDKNNNGFKGFELDAGEYIFKLMVNAHEIKNESTKFSLNLAANYQFAKDPVTNSDVKNRFTGADATNVTPLDRNDTSLYLSRADFKNTFKNTFENILYEFNYSKYYFESVL